MEAKWTDSAGAPINQYIRTQSVCW